jgi:hypothetical protein
MAFPTTSIISSFTGPDEDPLSEGGIWTVGAGVGINGINGSQERISNQAGARSGNAIYNVSTFGPNTESYATLPVLPTNGAGATYCYARLSALSATANGYSVDWRVTGGTNTMRLLRYDAGSGTSLGSWTQALSAGDAIGLEIIGSSLQAYVFSGGSWAPVQSPVTDGTYSAAGYVGFGITDVNARVDDFGGGTPGTTIAWITA